jgi:hypothetical protein
MNTKLDGGDVQVQLSRLLSVALTFSVHVF